jgi:oligopeptide/dipeptide ABC transporter ATP-binding protein
MFAGRYPHELSGGQRQRVALARALVSKPRLIVADEPVASLDVSVRAQVLSLIEETRRSLGVAFLFITHDLGVVRAIADRLAVMYLGQIVESGPTDLILREPKHPYTQALLDSTPVPDPALSRRRRDRIIRGEIPSATRPPDGCRFHPRCPVGMPVCSTLEPIRAASSSDPAWSAACHRALGHPDYLREAAKLAAGLMVAGEPE